MKIRSNAVRFLAVATLIAATAQSLGARPHNGLGEYERLFSGFGALPDWWLNDSSSLAYGAMGNMPALNSAGEISALLNGMDQPHYLGDPDSPGHYGSRDGRHPRNWGAWEVSGFAQWNFANYDRAPSRPVYDLETWGGGVALQRWVDGEHLVGFSASHNHNRVRLHNHGGTGGGTIEGGNARVRAYAALVPEGQPWWIAVGLSGGFADFDTTRHFMDLNGNATTVKANPDGYEVGAFAALNLRLRLTNELTFKPVLRLDYTSVSMARFKESTTGGGEPSQHFGSKINRFTAESLQSRLGAALEHRSDYGPFQLTASCSVAWADEWSGNDIKITSEFINYGAPCHVYAGQLFNDAVEFSPAFSLAFRNGLVLHGTYQLQVTFGGQFSQGVMGGVAWRF
ncbi:MAG: autotransporter outer membrane beta-barrel domain-containing protein [Puniceicoccales bacterium]|nr:autotransporter outer membrane beta-barrel domain-containing protein [Puniceicoccales bacterium]